MKMRAGWRAHYLLSRWSIGLSGAQRSGCVVTAFHGVFESREAVTRSAALLPFQNLTVEGLRRFVARFLDLGYRFVRTDEVAGAHNGEGRRICLTFDDGYANNLRVLPVLTEFSVPAAFFVSSGHVESGHAFWWDAYYRARHRQGAGDSVINEEIGRLKARNLRDILAAVAALSPDGEIRPSGDEDRPLSPAELQELSAHPCVEIGNHTKHHAILTRCGDDEVRAEIRHAQDYLTDLTGTTPTAIAYPNGDADERITRIAAGEGLTTGFTVAQRAQWRIGPDANPMLLPRAFVNCDVPLEQVVTVLAADNPLIAGIRRFQGLFR